MLYSKALAGTLAAIALASILVGCASPHPPAPASAASADYRYAIGPLDTLNVVVWRNPELSGSVQVRPDGRISTPLAQDVQAQGRSPAELAKDLEQILSKYIRDPVVTVIVTNFAGSNEQVRIIGEAAKPQAVPYRQNMTALDVIILAGGLTEFADGNRAVLVRGSEKGKQYNVRLNDLVRRGDMSANIELRPGDVLIVPQSWF
ncbi:MAG: XrtA/PEP-CTERM system exopolysaccharide export protein [Burkholderiaceae bacterium]